MKKRGAKLLSVILALWMVIAVVIPSMVSTGSATEAVPGADKWDGSIDTSLTYSDGYYLISSAEELAGVASLINNSATRATWQTRSYKLTCNIDLRGHEWIPIGNAH